MPLGPGVRFRFTRENGKKVRLALRDHHVLERKTFPAKKKVRRRPVRQASTD